MIVYFPEIYEDELIYSVFSRCYKHSTHMVYAHFIKEIYGERKISTPNFYFLNTMSQETINILGSLEDIVRNHTMYPYYSLFMKEEKKKEVLNDLILMNQNVLRVTPNKNGAAYIKYCPLCVKEDREKYGETYWHRIHQIPEIKVCAKHGCKLHSSFIIRKSSIPFNTAEDKIDNMEVIEGLEKEVGLAKYICKLIENHREIKGDIDYLISKIPYLSPGERLFDIESLYVDFMKYYENIDGMKKKNQIGYLLHKRRYNSYEIAQLAYFLNISVDDWKTGQKVRKETFHEKVIRMKNSGMKVKNICKQLGVSESTLRYTYNKKPKVKQENSPYYEELDEKMLKKVKEVISEMLSSDKPQRITVHGVSKRCGRELYHLNKCVAEINKYSETIEEFWCRKTIWGINKMLAKNITLNLNQFNIVTNLKRGSLERCIPLIKDEKILEILKGML